MSAEIWDYYWFTSAESEYLFKRHQSMAQNLSDIWRSTFEIGAVQLRPVTEIELKSFMWTEAPSGMVLAPAQELSDTVWT